MEQKHANETVYVDWATILLHEVGQNQSFIYSMDRIWSGHHRTHLGEQSLTSKGLKVSGVVACIVASLALYALLQFRPFNEQTKPMNEDPINRLFVSPGSEMLDNEVPPLANSSENNTNSDNEHDGRPVQLARLVELLNRNEQEHYQQIAEELSSSSRHALFEALSNPAYAQNWRHMLQLVSCFHDSEDALETLIQFAKESAHAIPVSVTGTSDIYLESKFMAVSLVGKFEFEQASEFLRQAVKEDGAVVVSEQWLDDIKRGQFERSQEYYLRELRSSAATGLAYTQDEQSVQLLREQFESAADEMRSILGKRLGPDETQRHMTEEEYLIYMLYSSYLDAVAYADLIADVGREEFFNTWPYMDTNEKLATMGPYLSRYTVDERRYQLKNPPPTSLN